MPDQADVRRIALGLPATGERPDRFAFFVDHNGKPRDFAWVWAERVEPGQPRVANPSVLAVRVSGEEEKQALIGAMPTVFFTEPHYNGFPAVLVRLQEVAIEHLEVLLEGAWRIQAPKALVRELEAVRAGPTGSGTSLPG